jgi:hypothetical protein
VTIRYDYYLWINNSNDGMRVEINNAGGEGPWTLLTTHNIGGGTSWRTQVFTHEDLLNAGVVLTDSMKLRFSAYDVDPQGQVEAGVDAVRIVASCVDCDSNGVDDRVEIADGSALDCNSNNIPDSCDVAAGTSVDCDGGPVGSVAGGAAIVNSICFGCHDSDGSGGPGFPGPSIRGRDRLFIRHKLLPPTDHPGGAFPDFTWQDFADIEAYLSDVGGRARPNLVPDECDATSDCNSNGVADGCDLAGGAGVDLDHSGVLDACEAGCGTTTGDVDGDCDVDLGDFAGLQRCYTGSLAGGTALASACLCLDVDGDGDVDEADYAGFAGVLAGPASPDESCTPSP